ncbi:ragulator complex protein LAMTOR1-like [Dysidea avara]|uniref:ragulator complex protein LAMTOR1-like n=1 Tax=Dysidea avara TaxID=196820 RepID=UPI003321F805
MGDCCSKEDEEGTGESVTSPLLGGNAGRTQTKPMQQNYGVHGGSQYPSMSRSDEESQLTNIVQQTVNDVIDVSILEHHSVESAEVTGRTREYHSKVNSVRANRNNRLPNSTSAPHVVLSRELVSPSDIRFISERAQSTSEALSNLDVKQGEPLVVQFATI